MVSSESELKSDVREQTGYTSTSVLSKSALDTAYRNAKRHLRVAAGLDSGIDWFDPEFPTREEALFWYTCLFAKTATGELDSQTVQVGAIDSETLLAKEGDEVTTWYRNAVSAKDSLSADTIFSISSPNRDGRSYGSNDSGFGSGGSNLSTDI